MKKAMMPMTATPPATERPMMVEEDMPSELFEEAAAADVAEGLAEEASDGAAVTTMMVVSCSPWAFVVINAEEEGVGVGVAEVCWAAFEVCCAGGLDACCAGVDDEVGVADVAGAEVVTAGVVVVVSCGVDVVAGEDVAWAGVVVVGSAEVGVAVVGELEAAEAAAEEKGFVIWRGRGATWACFGPSSRRSYLGTSAKTRRQERTARKARDLIGVTVRMSRAETAVDRE